MSNPYVIPVRVYFPNTPEFQKFHARIEALSDKTGMSVSKIVALSVASGFDAVEKNLQGLNKLPSKRRTLKAK